MWINTRKLKEEFFQKLTPKSDPTCPKFAQAQKTLSLPLKAIRQCFKSGRLEKINEQKYEMAKLKRL